MTVSALDVAAYILKRQGEMTTMKLQKLVYYCQAWGLVWDEKPLFNEQIEAWVNGPVVRELYEAHRGAFNVGPDDIPGNAGALDSEQVDTVENVLKYYGSKPSKYLVDLTHSEDPWILARNRAGLSPMERGDAIITHADMAEYYSSL